MIKTYLVLDCHYLAWRAHHTTGGLSYRGKPTGVIYGVLRAIRDLQELHATNRIVFCFDAPRKSLKRRLHCPGYKCSRDDVERPPMEQKLYEQTIIQIAQLRKSVLPALGFRNIFMEKGFEADDLIASFVDSLGKKEKAIIIGSDHDLYQLLGPRALLFNPTSNKAVTEESFSKEFGVTPIQWVDVKAIAGCKGDDVDGIRGIGEKTACSFLTGKLKSTSVAFQSIVQNNKRWKKNRLLVKLPFPGTPRLELRKDKVSEERWRKVCLSLGIKSIQELPTIGSRYGKAKKKEAPQGGRQGTKKRGFF